MDCVGGNPGGAVTLFSGDGGIGKSQLMLQLLASTALGRPWLGLPVRRCKCMGVFCEDDADEVHRRLDRILASYSASYADLGDLRLICRVGEDNVLVEFRDQWSAGKTTPFYGDLLQLVLDQGCELLVLDSLHEFFAGNESSRPQARSFMTALRSIALEMRGAVIVILHPSVAGRQNGSGEAGSTAWHNASRSRLYFTAPKRDDDEPDKTYRELKTMKSNYGASGAVIRLQWFDGVFVVQDAERAPINIVDKIDFDNRALAEMRKMIDEGAKLPADPAARNAFVNAVRKREGFRQIKQPTMIACQGRLILTKRAVVVEIGPPSKRTSYVRPAEARYAREVTEGSNS